MFLCFSFSVLSLNAQVVDPPSTVSAVVITAPISDDGTPFRTNRQTIALGFTAVVANGQFIATSSGGDIPHSFFIGQTGSGSVPVTLNNEGIHNCQVIVSSVNSGGTSPPVSSASKTIPVIYDATSPVVNVTSIKVNELQGWVPYSLSQQYYSNASQIGLRGNVVDQYTPFEQIVVKAIGMVSAEVQADSSGQFELTVSTGHLPDGPVHIDLQALETMSDGTVSSPSKSYRVSVSTD